MNDRNDWTPAEKERLEQQLLELHFGCHEHPEELEARLANEPALRELQARVVAQATVLEDAVRPSQDRLPLSTTAAPVGPARPRLWQLPLGRLTIAAAAAVLVSLAFLLFEGLTRRQLHSYRSEHLHLTISAPKAVPAGAPWSFTAQTEDLHGDATECRVQWRAFGEAGNVLAADEVATDRGQVTVALAADLEVPERVEVVARGRHDEVRQVFRLSTAMAGPLVHVSTDRPVYRPGEPVYVRAVVLDRVTRLPVGGEQGDLRIQARLFDAKDSPVFTDRVQRAPGGVGSFLLRIPEQSAGGLHSVRVASPSGRFAEQTASIVVRPFQNPQLAKTIVLDRNSYAPGARGSAHVSALRLADGSAAAGSVRAALVVDGDEVWHEQQELGPRGTATFRFALPKQIEQGAARFVATFTDAGIVEAEVEPFVVPTGRIRLHAFPEGGELIADVENGIYFECTDDLGRAIDTTGVLLDGNENRVLVFRTAHQGRARVTFVPKRDERYQVRLAGRAETTELPPARGEGIALRLRGNDIAAGEPLRIDVAGRGNGPWLLGVFCRGVLVGQTTLRADRDDAVDRTAVVELADAAIGVLRVTAFDRNLQPIAERLVRRLDPRPLDVDLSLASTVLAPGQKQTVDVHTRDHAGNSVRAIVGLACTDDAATSIGLEPPVSLVDNAMLFGDVAVLEDYGDYFLSAADGGRNVDLLLGTRGWRRFVWRNDDAARLAIDAAGDAGKSVLAREGFSQTPQVISNLSAANAPAGDLAASAYRAGHATRFAVRIAVLSFVLLALIEGLAWILRRATKAPPVLQSFVGAAAALGLMASLFVWLPRTLGSGTPPDAMVDRANGELLERDFEGEGAWQGLVDIPLADAGDWPNAIVDGLPVTGADEFFLGLGQREEAAGAFVVTEKPGPDLRLPEVAIAEPEVGFFFQPAASRERRPVMNPRQWRERQYAHQHRPGEQRDDFTSTICWNTLLVTDENGRAQQTFATSDAATTWTVAADAHLPAGDVGALGHASVQFTTELPLQVEAKLPDEVSAGDRLQIPVSVVAKLRGQRTVTLRISAGDGLSLRGDATRELELTPDADGTGRGRALLPIDVDSFVGATHIAIAVRAGRFVDRIRHQLQVAPRGFPHRRSTGGRVSADAAAHWQLTVPPDPVANSGHVTLKVFPSPIAAMTEGLAGMLREPTGCFEQASSSNYPNTLVLNLIEASGDSVPTVAARARSLLPKGYAKITGYECSEKGYEWFGHDPGHEALTAYGLLQFHDMANVYDVDMTMVDRTRQWLLQKRDGNGGFVRNQRALDRFGGSSEVLTNAYVTYALLQTGTEPEQLATEIDALARRVTTEDPYELALIACALQLAERPEADRARRSLAAMQREDGSLDGTTTTITRSGGNDRVVETTGFAVLAWLPDARFTDNVRQAVAYLDSARDGRGTFGATQATIVALRAITAYATSHRTDREDGVLRVFDGDRLLAQRRFGKADVEALTFELWDDLPAGEHRLRLEVEGGGDGPLPWAGELGYHAELPADDAGSAFAVTTALRSARVVEGRSVALDVTVENRGDEELPTPIAIVGIPAGLELPTSVLDDLQKAETFSCWELRGRELVLYWRKFDAGEKRRLTIDLIGRIPGRSSGSASRGYLYYTPEQKVWAAPLSVEVDTDRK